MESVYSFEITENPDKEVGHSHKWLRLCYCWNISFQSARSSFVNHWVSCNLIYQRMRKRFSQIDLLVLYIYMYIIHLTHQRCQQQRKSEIVNRPWVTISENAFPFTSESGAANRVKWHVIAGLLCRFSGYFFIEFVSLSQWQVGTMR